MSTEPRMLRFGDAAQGDRLARYSQAVRQSPLPDSELSDNLGIYMTPKLLSRILFMTHLYERILPVQGVVLEFGCRWGQNVCLFSSLRGILEPFNRLRSIVGFDTFSGLARVTGNDGAKVQENDYAVIPDYAKYLSEIATLNEQESPLSHLRKNEIVAGDICETLPKYLADQPHTVIAMAYFDLDIYAPTKFALQAIKPHLTKGSVLGFDELNDATTPGETIALREVMGLDQVRIQRWPHYGRSSFLVME
jgi:hypothetical protein